MQYSVETDCGPFRLTVAGGAGRPCVLIHGWGGTAAQWTALVPHLMAAHAVFLVDLPGGPAAPLTGPVSMTSLGEGVAACLRKAGVTDAILVGHSMGGPVMIETALAFSDGIMGLLGLDTLADRIYYGGSDANEIARRRAVFAADLEGETRRMVSAITMPDTSPTLCRQIADSILSAKADDLLALRDAMFAWSIADRLPLLRCPVHLLNSDEVYAAHERAPMPCLAIVPQSTYGHGHFPQIETPDALSTSLLEALLLLQEG